MKKIFSTIISILVVLAVIAGAFFVGIFYQTQKDSKNVSLAKDLLTKNLNIAAKGYIKSISGRTVTITDGNYGDMQIYLKPDAKISVLSAKSTKEEGLDIFAIKAGDFATLFIQPSINGGWEASTLYASVAK